MPIEPTLLLSRAKELRSDQTEAEKLLWYHLRNRRTNGLKFRRQVVIDNYIVDFMCLEKKLIVELDGGQHATQQPYDHQRDKALVSCGFHVMRFWNDQVLRQTDIVLNEIYQFCC